MKELKVLSSPQNRFDVIVKEGLSRQEETRLSERVKAVKGVLSAYFRVCCGNNCESCRLHQQKKEALHVRCEDASALDEIRKLPEVLDIRPWGPG